MTSKRDLGAVPPGVSGIGAGLHKVREEYEEPKPRCEGCGLVSTPHSFRPRPKTAAGTAGGEIETTSYVCDTCFYAGIVHAAKLALGHSRIRPEDLMRKAGFEAIRVDPENPRLYLCGVYVDCDYEVLLVARTMDQSETTEDGCEVLSEDDVTPSPSPSVAGAVYEAFDCLVRCAAKVRDMGRRPECFHKYDVPVPSCRSCVCRLGCFGGRLV